MSVTSGFFNSINNDRAYNAEQFSSIFDGLIVDGVFASIGDAFRIYATNSLTLYVGPGKAWFNHTWTVNDSLYMISAAEPDPSRTRVDMIVLEVNSDPSVRKNSIKYVKGIPGETVSSEAHPCLINSDTVHQYPLCYIDRIPGGEIITQAAVRPMVGSAFTPFVTGILQTVSIDSLLGKWQAELDEFLDLRSEEVSNYIYFKESEINAWVDGLKADLESEQALLDKWMVSQQNDFLTWFNSMRDKLDEDSAGKLQNELNTEEMKRILTLGLIGGTKHISDDGSVITTVANDGRVLTKVFSDDFRKMTVTLKNSNGVKVAELIKTFDNEERDIMTDVTFWGVI